MIEHTHTGFEMSCVLSGSFAHAGGHFGPGDFDLGEGSDDHEIMIDSADDCVCLVAMQGELQTERPDRPSASAAGSDVTSQPPPQSGIDKGVR